MHLIVHTAFFSVPVFLCVKSASMSMLCMIVHVCVSLYVLKRKKNRNVMCCEGKKRRKKKEMAFNREMLKYCLPKHKVYIKYC